MIHNIHRKRYHTKRRTRTLFCLAFVLLLMLSTVSCRKDADEGLLIDDGDIFDTAESTLEPGETVEQITLQPDDQKEEEAAFLPDSQVYNAGPEQIAADSEKAYYLAASSVLSSSTLQPYFLGAADRISGTVTPLCSKQDCSHDKMSCGAVTLDFGSSLTAISVSEDYLYYAGYSGSGGKVFRRKLPDGPAENIVSVNDDTLFPEQVNSTYIMNQSCFYKGDWYYSICAGNTGDSERSRETEYYATVVRSPISSQREAKTVIQDKVSGYDWFSIYLMPRDEGLYVIMAMEKNELHNDDELGKYLHTLGSLISVYLYQPDEDFYEAVFTGEYPEGQRIQNLNVLNGKLYYVTYSLEERKIRLFVQSMATAESTMLLEKEQDEESGYYSFRFEKDYIICSREREGEQELELSIELYDCEGGMIRSFIVNKPEEVKPQNPEDFIIEGRLSGETDVIGGDAYTLFCRDSYYSYTAGQHLHFDATYAVSLDGLRVTPFVEE